jgi:hypothetical protein
MITQRTREGLSDKGKRRAAPIAPPACRRGSAR